MHKAPKPHIVTKLGSDTALGKNNAIYLLQSLPNLLCCEIHNYKFVNIFRVESGYFQSCGLPNVFTPEHFGIRLLEFPKATSHMKHG